MKKMLISFAVITMMVVAAGLVSCNPNKTQCWLLKATFPSGKTQEMYFYGSGDEADAQLELMHQAGANQIHRESTSKSKSDCQ